MKHGILISLIIISAVSVSNAGAQSAATFLEVNPDAAVQALGGNTATAAASAFSFWNNTSATVLSDTKWQAGASYGLWQPSRSNVISAAGYGRIGKILSVSAGFKYFTYPSIDLSDEKGQSAGTGSPKDFSIGAGLAFRIIEGLSLSVNASYFNSDLGVPEVRKAGGVSADFGATYKFRKMRLGLSASNIGSKVDYGGTSAWNLPANSKLGFGGTLGTDEHSVNLDGQVGLYFTGTSFFASAAAEYVFHKMLSVRAGYHYGDEAKYIPPYVSAGLGFRWKWLKIDGAYLIPSGDSPLKNTFMTNLSVAF